MCVPPLVLLTAQGLDDLRPGFIPTVIADDVAQRQHGIDMAAGPVHAAALQARLDDQFVGALGGAVANRPTRCQKSRIVHVSLALLQICQMRCQVRRLRSCCYQVRYFSDDGIGAILFEFVQLGL